MIVLGVDPGLSMTGWGFVAADGRNSLSMLQYGCIRTKPAQTLTERLKFIHHTLQQIIRDNHPDEMAIEELFFSKEARTVAAVGQARGVILLTAGMENLPIHEYNPRYIKMSMTGYGSADKSQMQHMVKTLLRLREIPQPDDAADAIAMAVCHLHTRKW
jgi:crossover junction endodeoxyribonuclease RuvC